MSYDVVSGDTFMRMGLTLNFLLAMSGAYAQQCGECTLADACIREYSRAVAKTKAEAKKGIHEFQSRIGETNLSESDSINLSRRGTGLIQKNSNMVVRLQIETLKECLGKIW